MSRVSGPAVVEENRASVVNEVINQPVQNEIVVASRPNQLAGLPAGALIDGYHPGYGPMGFQLCSSCRRYWHTSFSETVCYRCRNTVGFRGGFDDRSSYGYGSGCSYGSGYGSGYGHGYGHGYGRCSYCERGGYSGGCGCHGGIGICRDRCGRPSLFRPCSRRIACEKKTVKRYYC
ncbi:hypothetical protein LZ30DRAFT_455417 [Colletotrichum cereale]|nr:hypothetical protein LZ30DRAFT_455417 [Colletotrichum cereale]